MAIYFRSVLSNAKQILKQKPLHIKIQKAVPKVHIPVYVGGQAERKRYVVPLSYLSHSAFQDLLHHTEEEFGFNHPKGGLTILCTEEAFFRLASKLRC